METCCLLLTFGIRGNKDSEGLHHSSQYVIFLIYSDGRLYFIRIVLCFTQFSVHFSEFCKFIDLVSNIRRGLSAMNVSPHALSLSTLAVANQKPVSVWPIRGQQIEPDPHHGSEWQQGSNWCRRMMPDDLHPSSQGQSSWSLHKRPQICIFVSTLAAMFKFILVADTEFSRALSNTSRVIRHWLEILWGSSN